MRNLNWNFGDSRTFLTDDLQGRSQRIGNNSDIGNRLPACTDTFPISLLERRAINHTNRGVKLACAASVYAWLRAKFWARQRFTYFPHPSPLLFYTRDFWSGPRSLFRSLQRRLDVNLFYMLTRLFSRLYSRLFYRPFSLLFFRLFSPRNIRYIKGSFMGRSP